MKESKSGHLLLKTCRFLKPYWKKGVGALFLMFFTTLLSLPLPFLTKYIIDKVVVAKDFHLLQIIGFSLIAIIILQSLTGFVKGILLTVFSSRVLFDIRVKLFEHLQDLSLKFFRKNQTGYLMSRISSDVQSLHGLLADTILSIIQNALTFIVGIGAVFYIHKKLALISLLILPIYALVTWFFSRKIRTMSWELREKYAEAQKEIQELISGIFTIQSFSAEKTSLLRMFKSTKGETKQSIKLSVFGAFYVFVTSIVSSSAPLVILWYGCFEIMRGNLTIGGLIAFNSFVRYLFGPTSAFVNINLTVQQSLASAERVFEIMDTEPDVKDAENAVELNNFKGEIVFENVSFSYENENVLENVSIRVKNGEKVALVGPSGAGKTTIVNLLMRFYDPDEGKILLDGTDLKDIKIKSLRSNIALVSQDVFLFRDSVRENIRFGSPSATDEQVYEAAEKAFADVFIKKMDKGYDTVVGERGATLSGGERQRISIARAILKNAKILVLDEATSQLDSESENYIRKALDIILTGRTAIVIAHRLNTVKDMDRIIVLNKGEIIMTAKHDELFEKCEFYKNLYKSFSGSAA